MEESVKNYPEIIVKHSGYLELPRIVDERDGALCRIRAAAPVRAAPALLYHQSGKRFEYPGKTRSPQAAAGDFLPERLFYPVAG